MAEVLHLMTQDELDRIVVNVRQQVRECFLDMKSHMVERPLTRTEAAKFLGIKLTAFDKRIRNGHIPASMVHKNGGTPYFFPSELEKLLKKS